MSGQPKTSADRCKHQAVQLAPVRSTMQRRKTPRWAAWMPAVSSVVDELEGEVELLALQQRDDRLQIVLLLGRDAQLLALDLGPDALRPLVPDGLGQLLGVVLADALLEGDGHPVLLAGELGIARVQGLERHAAPDQLVLNTSRTALARSSLLARISTACSPDQAMDAPTPRKSNRVPISLAAWLSALSTSWRSSLDTMSNEDSWDATAPRLDARTAGRHAERAGRRTSYGPDGPSANRLVVSWAILSMPPERRHTAGCPSGQRERSV